MRPDWLPFQMAVDMDSLAPVKCPSDFLSDALEKTETFLKDLEIQRSYCQVKCLKNTLIRSIALARSCTMQITFSKIHLSIFFVFLAALR